MSQQINLFNPVFLKEEKYFSAVTMLQALGLMVVGLGIFYAFILWQDAGLVRQVADSTRSYEQQKQQFAKVSDALTPERRETQLDQDLKATEAAIASRQALLRDIQAGVSADASGYSEYLRAFARQTVQGLWLTGIQVEGSSGQLNVSGHALQADLVPIFIGRLKAEPILHGRPLEALTISQSKVDGPGGPVATVDFTVNSELMQAAKNPGPSTPKGKS